MQCGQDLGTSVEWLNRVLGLQLLSLADDQGCALVATGARPGSEGGRYRLPPLEAGVPPGSPASPALFDAPPAPGLHRGAFRLELLAPPAGTPSGGGSPSGGSSSGTAGTFGHFCLAVPSTAAVLDRLRAGGQAGLILQECAAVTPVRAGGRTQTVGARACDWWRGCWGDGLAPSSPPCSPWQLCPPSAARAPAGLHEPDPGPERL